MEKTNKTTKRTGKKLGIVLSAVALVVSYLHLLEGTSVDPAVLAIVFSGLPMLVSVIGRLVRERRLHADILVPIAMFAAMAVQAWFAAGMVGWIAMLVSLLEDNTARHAQEGIEQLMRLTPQTAHVLRDGQQTDVPVESVAVGDELVVLAGETIPVDGVIVSGETSVDQSVITGEPMPVDKAAGDGVLSGTINQFASFTMRAEHIGRDSTMQRMVQIAGTIEADKAPMIGIADKWGTILVLAAIVLAAIVFAVTGEASRAVAILVCCCPVAFTMATTTAFLAGVANASRYGIIIRSGDVLERLGKVTKVAFDKTGTLTFGAPKVVAVRTEKGVSEEELLVLAASAEQQSEHPLGKALLAYAREQGMELLPAEEFAMTAGMGIQATVCGKKLLLGKPEYMKQHGFAIPYAATMHSDTLGEDEGATSIFVLRDGEFIGFIAFADTLRLYARTLITRLGELKLDTVLLTGDREATAKTIAYQLNMKQVYANLLPEDKLDKLREMEQGKEHVCMVGDGVNDSLALKAAYTSIAMGGIGSDVAVESADVVLVDDEVRKVSYLFELARKVVKKVRNNIFIAMSFNFWFLLLAAVGGLSPSSACLVHIFSALLVAANSATLRMSWNIG
ncbi:MAG: cation-translocating P-type ATPase [Eubacteriales bacterium]|nr:cation-translocating P-type ATPase [Eubacteriales bacterium]